MQLRIQDFPLGGADPLGGGGGANLRHGHFLAEMYAKMNELGPIGGGALAAPPGSATEMFHFVNFCINNFTVLVFLVFL